MPRTSTEPLPSPSPRQRPWLRKLGMLGFGLALAVAGLQGYAWYCWSVAHEALERQELGQASEHLRRCLGVWRWSASTYLLLARTCRRDNHWEAAGEALQEARRWGCPQEDIDLERLLVRAQNGAAPRLEAALWPRIEAGGSEAPLILEALTQGSLKCQLVDRAHRYSSHWVTLAPQDWYAWLWHGRVLEQGLNLERAAEAFAVVLSLRPDQPEAHLRMGNILVHRNRHGAAQTHLEAYLKHHPDDAAALVVLARCQRAEGAAEAAQATLERAATREPDATSVWQLRAQLALDADRPAEALPWLEKAMQSTPQDRDVHKDLALTLRRLGREAQALVHEQRFDELDREQQRLEELTREIAKRPRELGLRYEAGKILMRLEKYDVAARWFVSVLLQEPDHRASREALAGCLRTLNDPRLEAIYRPILHGERERN